MGTYNLDYKEIASAMEECNVEAYCEGDFTEKTFIKGAKEYLTRLREEGASIPKGDED